MELIKGNYHILAIGLNNNSNVFMTKAFILKFVKAEEEICLKRFIVEVNFHCGGKLTDSGQQKTSIKLSAQDNVL